MKIKLRPLLIVMVSLALPTIDAQLSTVFGQGSLTPPGAPGPTMKSLDQIEARTPISSYPFVIYYPGSYYLTANLNVTAGNAIVIGSSDVTLDLNGFTISSSDPYNGGAAVTLAVGNTDISIINGHITGGVTYDSSSGVYSGSGFGNGIYYGGTEPLNVRVTGVSVSGCLDAGIDIANAGSTVVESCTVQNVGGYGIVAGSVSHSLAYQCGNTAISANVASDCYGSATLSGDGLDATDANNCNGFSANATGLSASTANNCAGSTGMGSYGLYANNANNCSGSAGVDGTGLYATYNAAGCNGYSGTGTGLYANTATGCYGTSSASDGLYANSAAENCYGTTTGGTGLYSGYNAIGSFGTSSSGTGLNAVTAANCYGNSTSGTGLNAGDADNCYGTSAYANGLTANAANNCTGSTGMGNFGLNANTANNCTGSAGIDGTGVSANYNAIGCYGISGTGRGVSATTVINCVGQSTGNGYGIYASQLAAGSSGSSVSGTGLYARYIANTCAGFSTNGTGLQTTSATSSGGIPNVVAPYQYTMP